MAHLCVGNLTIIGSDNGLAPGRHQAIIWTNSGILLIGTLETNFSEISIEMQPFSFTKMRLKVSSAKWRPFCFGLNVLIVSTQVRPWNLNSPAFPVYIRNAGRVWWLLEEAIPGPGLFLGHLFFRGLITWMTLEQLWLPILCFILCKYVTGTLIQCIVVKLPYLITPVFCNTVLTTTAWQWKTKDA